MTNKLQLKKTVTEEFAGMRLDQVISKMLPEHSRARIQGWIRTGQIRVNEQNLRQRAAVHTGDEIEIDVVFETLQTNQPEHIPLDIIHADSSIILVNKPAGLVVHPGAGNPNQTLVNALLHYDSNLRLLPRAGIVHRLDKDTSGILLVARKPEAHTYLVEKLQARQIKREYQALVCGLVTAGGTVEGNIGRHPTRRTRMAITASGKPATTHYRLLKKFKHYTLLQVVLETGRTHQIRVHMASINHPLIGDPIYGKNKSLLKGINEETRQEVTCFKRQALHAYALTLAHPETDTLCTYTAELPADMHKLIETLAEHDRA